MENDLNTLNVNLTNENYPFEHGVNVGQGIYRRVVFPCGSPADVE